MNKGRREACILLTEHLSGRLQIRTKCILNRALSNRRITICNVHDVAESFHKEKSWQKSLM